MSAFNMLGMRPVRLLVSDEVDSWGNDVLEVLLAHFGEEKSHRHQHNLWSIFMTDVTSR